MQSRFLCWSKSKYQSIRIRSSILSSSSNSNSSSNSCNRPSCVNVNHYRAFHNTTGPCSTMRLSTQSMSTMTLNSTEIEGDRTNTKTVKDNVDVSYFANEALRHVMANSGDNDNDNDNDDTRILTNQHNHTPSSSPNTTSSTWQKMVQQLDKTKPVSRPQLFDLLRAFEPDYPPSEEDENYTWNYQIWLECESMLDSTLKYERMLQVARENKKFSQLSAVQQHVVYWYEPLRDAIENLQKLYFSSPESSTATQHQPNNNSDEEDTTVPFKHGDKYLAYISLLHPEKLAVITAHETITVVLGRGGTAPLAALSMKIGEAVEAEINLQKLFLRKDEATGKLVDDTINTSSNSNIQQRMYAESNLLKFVQDASRTDPAATKNQRMHVKVANKRAKKLLNSDEEWSTIARAKLGAMLVELLIRTARMTDATTTTVPVEATDATGTTVCDENSSFYHEKRWAKNKRLVGQVTMNPRLYKHIMETNSAKSALSSYHTKFQPMVRVPRDWTALDDGAYYVIPTNLMRTKGCKPQLNALKISNLDLVLDGLNALGRVPWKINSDIMDAAKRCWDDGIALGDIPSQVDVVVPPLPQKPAFIDPTFYAEKKGAEYEKLIEDWRAFRNSLNRYKKMKQKNMDLYSLRCSAMLKLNQAEKFRNTDEIYFPYNLDFRGRAYPVPPHLSNIGSDLCRGMLTFAKSKPLGERGLYWLKVHLANLAGADKMSFEERAAFTELNMDNVREAAQDSFGDNNHETARRWWMSLEDPFQALATCKEIIQAIDSGDPPSYQCSLPVHMDGSCNGLQHYAALGRDYVGGRAVNLTECEVPQDVYVFVMKRVIDRIAKEAATTPSISADVDSSTLSVEDKRALRNNAAAKLVNGYVDRGVVKRTVMTSVYGVTYIGARAQIQEKLEEKLEAAGMDVGERTSEIYAASGYLASVTMDVMGELFQGARQTMNWLAECAKLISARGQPMAWLSPIGVPVVQPYRQSKSHTIVTLLQTINLTGNNDSLPIHKQRQVTAFPPNYVHSLDSSHMLLTALEMDRRGLAFTAVHDSFWTHPSDIDELNFVLRESFIDLYKKPLLQELKRNWELRYPDIEFPDVPERGELDLEEVKKARYFFQ